MEAKGGTMTETACAAAKASRWSILLKFQNNLADLPKQTWPLLRTLCNRPSSRTAEKRYELAPSHKPVALLMWSVFPAFATFAYHDQ
jgi:hypothetical protein